MHAFICLVASATKKMKYLYSVISQTDNQIQSLFLQCSCFGHKSAYGHFRVKRKTGQNARPNAIEEVLQLEEVFIL